MTKKHKKGITFGQCSVLVFALLLIGIPTVFFDIYYDLNDDTMIKDILSGAYTGKPDAHCIQMLYPVSWIISMCYRAIPGLPWYGLFLCLCQFGVFVLIAWRLTHMIRGRAVTVLVLVAELFVVLGMFLREIVIVQYSVTSALCMAGAVFMFMTCSKVDRTSEFIRSNLISVLLVVMSFMIRTEMCIMLIPFLMLAGLAKWMYEKKPLSAFNLRKYLTLIFVAVVIILAMLSIDRVAYGSADWKSFKAFFNARTDLYDFYGLPSYDENKEFYDRIGLSRESYTLLENYNFALDDSIDAWTLESIAEYQRQKAYSGEELEATFGYVSRNSIGEALWMYKDKLITGAKALTTSFFGENAESDKAVGHYVILAAYVLYILLCFLPLKNELKSKAVFKVLVLLAVRSVLWIYLFMVDRAIDRVTMPIGMLELTVLTGFIINDIGYSDNTEENRIMSMVNKVTNVVVIVFMVMFMSAALVNNFKLVKEECDNRSAADIRWNALMEYCRDNEESYYVIDVYSSTSYNGAPYSEKIFKNVDNSYKNFDICGGWAAKSPVAEQKLKYFNLSSVKSALYMEKDGRKAYFIAAPDKDLSWLEAFYAKRGQQLDIKCVDTITAEAGGVVFYVYG